MTDFDSENSKLDPSQVQAIAALLTEKDTKSAAAKAGISVESLYRWLKDADFKAALDAAETEVIAQVIRRLAGNAGDALDTLIAIHKTRRQPIVCGRGLPVRC